MREKERNRICTRGAEDREARQATTENNLTLAHSQAHLLYVL